FAKSIGLYAKKTCIPVDHVVGHIASNYITHKDLEPPFVCLTVSGGHTQLVQVKNFHDFQVIGCTRDDAAGEVFDKVGRFLGLGYPAGPQIDRVARHGDKERYKLPQPRVKGAELDFSFSGLKTATINLIRDIKQSGQEVNLPDLAASFQNSVVSVLLNRLLEAARVTKCGKLCISGGVSANSELRERAATACESLGCELFFPEIEFCSDNAAMIASQGYYEFTSGSKASAST
ncbi:MAG: tRNA (adenosine(37)-N6)-threonylcarbamoyltransferase complex transferase subunit TsaD, partial [Oscillospiraceae bacterium]|nr:tRNA (adenosine(37)-N6)-threonylcarbamoyltransferase complex transferase subunit TsaD [Oscillospiraceae bacterium]